MMKMVIIIIIAIITHYDNDDYHCYLLFIIISEVHLLSCAVLKPYLREMTVYKAGQNTSAVTIVY